MLLERESFIALWAAGLAAGNFTVAYLVKQDYNEKKENGSVSNFKEYWSKGVDYFNNMIL